MYTKEQQYTRETISKKVQDFFETFPVKGHGFDHAYRVAADAKAIAQKEYPDKIFLCEISGLLHDIGRVTEHYTPGNTKTHHELSYELLRKWFVEDRIFDIFSDEEKKELLYGIRYHYNDAADLYPSAFVLRDADKIDLLGPIGLERCCSFFAGDEKAILTDLYKKYYCYYWLRTQTARQKVDDEKLMDPVTDFFVAKLRASVEDIQL